jgi:hypothetical protein
MSEHYRADQLQEPVQIIRKTNVADGAGGFSETEQTLPSSTTFHFAFVRPLRGQEQLVNDRVASQVELMFVMHSAIALVPTDVVLYQGVRYDITGLPPVIAFSEFREVTAVSGGVN